MRGSAKRSNAGLPTVDLRKGLHMTNHTIAIGISALLVATLLVVTANNIRTSIPNDLVIPMDNNGSRPHGNPLPGGPS